MRMSLDKGTGNLLEVPNMNMDGQAPKTLPEATRSGPRSKTGRSCRYTSTRADCMKSHRFDDFMTWTLFEAMAEQRESHSHPGLTSTRTTLERFS
jgi:hypothetical protein